jgi:hypothetical protein
MSTISWASLVRASTPSAIAFFCADVASANAGLANVPAVTVAASNAASILPLFMPSTP